MGDNIYLGDRDGVRTPMQWSPDRNGGFSRADPAALVLPPIMDPLYGYERGQCRGADARSAFAAATGCGACSRSASSTAPSAAAACVALSEEPQGSGLSARVRRARRSSASPTVAHAAGGRARSVGVRRPRAGRAAWRLAVPADRPAHLSADAAALRLLLVRARRAQSELARLAHASARAAAGVRDAGSPRQPRRGAFAAPTAPCWSARYCRHTSSSGAGSAPRTRRSKSIAYRLPRQHLREPSASCCSARSRSKSDGGASAGCCRWRSCGRTSRRRAAQSAGAGARAARAAHRAAHRCLLAAGFAHRILACLARAQRFEHAGRA